MFELTPEQKAQIAFNDGAKSSDNPYVINTTEWCLWAKEFGRLNDEYMALAISDDA